MPRPVAARRHHRSVRGKPIVRRHARPGRGNLRPYACHVSRRGGVAPPGRPCDITVRFAAKPIVRRHAPPGRGNLRPYNIRASCIRSNNASAASSRASCATNRPSNARSTPPAATGPGAPGSPRPSPPAPRPPTAAARPRRRCGVVLGEAVGASARIDLLLIHPGGVQPHRTIRTATFLSTSELRAALRYPYVSQLLMRFESDAVCLHNSRTDKARNGKLWGGSLPIRQ